jgi:hypothetical protein
MTVAAPPRRRFLRQGQLAGSAVGGIVVAVIVGLLPPQVRLVERGPELNTSSLADVARWLLPIAIGMGVGYLAWVLAFERRRPTVRGGGWTSERDWAITGGLFAAFLLTRLFALEDGTSVSGLYPTNAADVYLLVDAPIDIAKAMVRFLASASIAAILFRVTNDWWQALRDRGAGARGPD